MPAPIHNPSDNHNPILSVNTPISVPTIVPMPVIIPCCPFFGSFSIRPIYNIHIDNPIPKIKSAFFMRLVLI